MVVRAIANIVVTAGALLLISRYLPGITVAGTYAAFVVAIIWGILGLTVRPVLNLLTLPINLITFGLFSFVLNALLFWLMGTFIDGFDVAGFIPALEGSLILMLVSWALHSIFK